jgi:peptidoglycan/LPS O-acetylase OafA/YrhL
LLAPLPRLYRIVVVAVVLALGIGAGVWLTQSWDLPAGGFVVGCLAGLVIAYLLVHDFHRPQPRTARVTRRH